MRTLSILKAALWICAYTTLCGCATRLANDVELRSVEPVYMAGKASWSLEGWVPDTGSIDLEEPNPDAASHLRLKVTFTTSVNIPKLAKEQADGLTIDERFCDQPDEDVLLVASSIYVPKQQGRTTLSWWNQEKVDPPLEYFFLLDVKGARRETYHFIYHAFDLINQPSDVCFALRGNRWLSPGYRSNTIMIPRVMIEAALRDLPPAYR